MKKLFFIILLLITITLTGCSNSNLKTINVDELNKKLNDKESFILFFSNSETSLEDTLTSVLKQYDLVGYKIDISKLDDKTSHEMKLKFAYNDPSIIFVVKGEDPGVLSHITDTSIRSKNIIKRLIDMNFIKEE